MTDDQWLYEYTGQSTAELVAMVKTYRVDSLVVAFEQAILQKAERVGVDSLSDVERLVLAVEALERDINNGGYHQYFLNAPEFAPIAVESLLEIGCPITAAITQNAIAALGIPGALTAAAIEAAASTENDERDAILQDCDGQFYEAGEDIASFVFQYIMLNQSKVVL